MFDFNNYKVYIKINESNIITEINSSAFITDTTDWIEIDEGDGDKYLHAQNNYLPEFIIDENGNYQYKYEDGVIIKLSEEELLPKKLQYIIATKISELSNICTQTIYNGIDIKLSDGKIEHFTLDEQDQLNLSGIGLKLLMGAQTVAWHEDNENESCRFYSALDAQTIISNLTVFKEYHITYFRDLRIYVRSLTSIEDIEEIAYGFILPDEFKSDVLKEYEKLITENN